MSGGNTLCVCGGVGGGGRISGMDRIDEDRRKIREVYITILKMIVGFLFLKIFKFKDFIFK